MIVALATAMAVPVVGTLLVFSLMIGAPAAARTVTDRPGRALVLSVVIALVAVGAAIAGSYQTDYPVGFFVGTISCRRATSLGRVWSAVGRRPRRVRTGSQAAADRPLTAVATLES